MSKPMCQMAKMIFLRLPLEWILHLPFMISTFGDSGLHFVLGIRTQACQLYCCFQLISGVTWCLASGESNWWVSLVTGSGVRLLCLLQEYQTPSPLDTARQRQCVPSSLLRLYNERCESRLIITYIKLTRLSSKSKLPSFGTFKVF